MWRSHDGAALLSVWVSADLDVSSAEHQPMRGHGTAGGVQREPLQPADQCGLEASEAARVLLRHFVLCDLGDRRQSGDSDGSHPD